MPPGEQRNRACFTAPQVSIFASFCQPLAFTTIYLRLTGNKLKLILEHIQNLTCLYFSIFLLKIHNQYLEMNIRLLFSFILMALASSLQAQKLVSTDNLWYLTQKGYPTGQGLGDTLNFSVFFKDSVLINGYYYYQLETSLGEDERR
jgi:hypothetical protein